MRQVNVKIDDRLASMLDRVAAAKNISATELLRQMIAEMGEAHDAGRLVFTREEGPKLDSSLNALAVQLRDAIVEIDRSQRENAKIAKRLIDATSGGQEAFCRAQEELTNRLVAQRKEANIPFLEQVGQLREEIAALPDAIGNQLEEQLAPLAKEFASVAREARAPKSVRNIIVGGEFIQEWPVISTIAGVWFIVGILTLLIGGNFLPGLGRAMANQFVDNDVALCRQLNNRFQTEDCALPDLKRRNALNTISLEKLP